MKIYIGIEGIGTRFSIAVASNASGNILASARLSNCPLTLHTTSPDQLKSSLFQLLKRVMEGCNLKLEDLADATICMGITGITFFHDAEIEMPRIVEELELDISPQNLICTGDAEIVFASHTQSAYGSAIICHLGSTAYIVLGDEGLRVGGWGPSIGDEGAGCWMGRSALRAIGLEHDRKLTKNSILWQKINSWLKNPNGSVPAWQRASAIWGRRLHEELEDRYDPRTAIFYFTHEVALLDVNLRRSILSSLTIPLMQAWEEGDPTANQITHDAASLLTEHLSIAYSVAEVARDFGPVVLYGGLFNHNPRFTELVKQKLTESVCSQSVKFIDNSDPCALRPVMGALMFALGGSQARHLRLPNRNVIDNLRRLTSLNSNIRNDLKND